MARSTVLQRIENISLKTSNIIVKDFGGEVLLPKYKAELEFTFSDIFVKSVVYVVDFDLGNTEFIIGQSSITTNKFQLIIKESFLP